MERSPAVAIQRPAAPAGAAMRIRGACAPWRNFQKNEREAFTERRSARQAHEFLAAASSARSYRKLFKVEGKEKLLGIGPPTPGVGRAARAARDRYFLRSTRPRERA